MNIFREKREIAQSEALDKTVKIISSFLPGGTAAYELITTLVAPLHEKKKCEFINDLAIRLKRLEEQELIDFEKLAQNEEFNTIITKAILLAQQNHQKEKLEALKNVVLNSALKITKESLKYDSIEYYVRLINTLSLSHLKILKALYDENHFEDAIDKIGSSYSMINFGQLLKKLISGFDVQDEFLQLTVRELFNYGLTNKESTTQAIGKDNKLDEIRTEIGKSFMEYILSPSNQA